MSYHFSNKYPELKKKLPLQKIIFDCRHLISALKFDPRPLPLLRSSVHVKLTRQNIS